MNKTIRLLSFSSLFLTILDQTTAGELPTEIWNNIHNHMTKIPRAHTRLSEVSQFHYSMYMDTLANKHPIMDVEWPDLGLENEPTKRRSLNRLIFSTLNLFFIRLQEKISHNSPKEMKDEFWKRIRNFSSSCDEILTHLEKIKKSHHTEWYGAWSCALSDNHYLYSLFTFIKDYGLCPSNYLIKTYDLVTEGSYIVWNNLTLKLDDVTYPAFQHFFSSNEHPVYKGLYSYLMAFWPHLDNVEWGSETYEIDINRPWNRLYWNRKFSLPILGHGITAYNIPKEFRYLIAQRLNQLDSVGRSEWPLLHFATGSFDPEVISATYSLFKRVYDQADPIRDGHIFRRNIEDERGLSVIIDLLQLFVLAGQVEILYNFINGSITFGPFGYIHNLHHMYIPHTLPHFEYEKYQIWSGQMVGMTDEVEEKRKLLKRKLTHFEPWPSLEAINILHFNEQLREPTPLHYYNAARSLFDPGEYQKSIDLLQDVYQKHLEIWAFYVWSYIQLAQQDPQHAAKAKAHHFCFKKEYSQDHWSYYQTKFIWEFARLTHQEPTDLVKTMWHDL